MEPVLSEGSRKRGYEHGRQLYSAPDFFLVYYAVAKVEQIEAGALDAYS